MQNRQQCKEHLLQMEEDRLLMAVMNYGSRRREKSNILLIKVGNNQRRQNIWMSKDPFFWWFDPGSLV